MNWQNNVQIIRQNLKKNEAERIALLEQQRLLEKARAVEILKAFFLNIPDCKVWLFGSIIRQFDFASNSDIDIAVAAYKGSRLDLFGELEKLMNRNIDLVILEKSTIREEIELQGEQIV